MTMQFMEQHFEAIWVNGDTNEAALVPVLVLAGIDASKVLVARGDTGDLVVVPTAYIRTNWRYVDGSWIDINHPEDAGGNEPDDAS